ncbi:hypothetical protein BH23GEM9_BH23GEM9_18310 [soil metagenome]
MNRIHCLCAATLLLALAAPASSQSLFGTRGLGVLAPPVDARGAALGGIGVGLIGFHTSLTNPAEIAGVTRRGVSVVLQPVSTSAEADGESDNISGTRFPVLRIIYPVNERLVASLAYGSYLDQSWSIITETAQVVGDQTVTARDQLSSTGGIAQFRVGAAYTLSPTLAVGAAAGLLTGNVERTATRRFVDDTTGTLRPFEERLRWTYMAPLASLGVRWDVAGVARIGASAMIAGNVEADVRQGLAESRTYGAPLELAAGASTRFGPLLTANAGAVWSRPPTTEGETTSRETVRVGGGLEYQGVRSGVRTYPIRIGARWGQLPYHLATETPPTEWSAGAGIGFRLGEPANPAALADISIERGTRSGLDGGIVAGGVREQSWRLTFSLSLFGN